MIQRWRGLPTDRVTAAHRASAVGLQLVIYSRAACHLCHAAIDDARDVVAAMGLPEGVLTVIDIDAEPALRERYGERVPVGELNDRHLFDYRCDEAALKAALVAQLGQSDCDGAQAAP